MSVLFTWIAPIVVPVAVGGMVLWFSQHNPGVGSRPALTSFCLFVLLIVGSALLSPGGDLIGPAVGGVTSIFVCVVVYILLRRRLTTTRELATR